MQDFRIETDSLGEVKVPADKLWGAQTERSREHFSIGAELMPKEMIPAYGVLKKAAALANHALGLLDEEKKDLIAAVCDEILAGRHDAMFPLRVWMTGSGTQFNMNVNEVIANRASQMAGQPLGSKKPLHPNDDVNMSQSTNDNFPTAMYMAAAKGVAEGVIPAGEYLREGLAAKAKAWASIVKAGRTHYQDATPLTLGQEFSGYAAMLEDALERLRQALPWVLRLALGGTAVGTGLNAPKGFAERAVEHIRTLTGLPFTVAPNRFAAQGAHDALAHLSGALKGLAVSLHKIASDIRLLGCGPRTGIAELKLPANEPGSSMMPGKVNPTQCEAVVMVSMQVMANDVAVALGCAGGTLEMNAQKPLIIHNVMGSVRMLADVMRNFRKFLVDGLEPDEARIAFYVERSLMLVTALVPEIGYEKAARIALHAQKKGMTLREAALELGVDAGTFDSVVKPETMV